MREGGPGLFMGGLPVNHHGITLLCDLFGAIPDLFHKGTGGIVPLHRNALVTQAFFHVQRRAESRDDHNVFCGETVRVRQDLSFRIHQETDPLRLEIGVHKGIVDHFAQQEYPSAGMLFYGPESDLDRVLHSVTEAEMTRQRDLQRSEIQEGGREVLFQPVFLAAFLLDGGDEGTPVGDRHVEALHERGIGHKDTTFGRVWFSRRSCAPSFTARNFPRRIKSLTFRPPKARSRSNDH